MTTNCIKIINDLSKAVNTANLELIDNMTDPNMRYEYVCVKPDVTYEHYAKTLKSSWEKSVNDYIVNPSTCDNLINYLTIYRNADLSKAQNIMDLFSDSKSGILESNILNKINIDELVLDVTASTLMNPASDTFEFSDDAAATFYNLANTMYSHCSCEIVDIFKYIIRKYRKKYSLKLQGKSKSEIIDILRRDYNNFKNVFQTMATPYHKNLDSIDDIDVTKTALNDAWFSDMWGFSIRSELDRLIPNELGSLKEFFTQVISTYYENLHPIVWAQIFKYMNNNVFVDLPLTRSELFAFGSKSLLLNSGPFILKILQMIRPVLTPELAEKYNLTKLTYPVLTPSEVELMLSRAMIDWDMYNVLMNFSASVGHVCMVNRADNPENVFIVKLIKPLAVAQSCWEYKTLYNIFPEGSCEESFVRHMLESNGRELNVANEISNINKGHEYYNANYREVFGVDIDAKLDAVQHIDGVIRDGIWYALAMTLAPGIPISKLVEGDLLKSDTKYRAKLHRGLDLLVFKFFQNIIKTGFYHGDPHAGNIFFSYEKSQVTLIDFGAVGEIDIYSDDPSTRTLIDVIVMSLFYNYEEILDRLTELLNSRCVETQIDINSPEYIALRKQLAEYHRQNIINSDAEVRKAEIYRNDIFSAARIQAEKSNTDEIPQIQEPRVLRDSTIYSYLEYKPREPEVVVENRDTLPVFTEVLGDTTSMTFTKILEIIIKYYATAGVNIAIKFSDFYEFQKSYALLLGVLAKVDYSSYRANMAIERAIVNWSNLPELRHVGTVGHVFTVYRQENEKYNKYKSELVDTNGNPLPKSTSMEPPKICMMGGDIYKQKYLKYKNKYLQAKNSMLN